MNDDIEIFKVDEDGLLIINKPEIITIKEYSDIYNRPNKDKKNQRATIFNEFLFIYLYCNPNSMYSELPVSERYDKVKQHCKFEDEWVADDILLNAIERYESIDLNLNAFTSAYYNTKRGIYSIGVDIELMGEINDTVRDRLKEDKKILPTLLDEISIQECTARISVGSNTLIENNDKIMKLSERLPKALDTVEILYKKMINKRDEDAKIFGGGKLNNRED